MALMIENYSKSDDSYIYRRGQNRYCVPTHAEDVINARDSFYV